MYSSPLNVRLGVLLTAGTVVCTHAGYRPLGRRVAR